MKVELLTERFTRRTDGFGKQSTPGRRPRRRRRSGWQVPARCSSRCASQTWPAESCRMKRRWGVSSYAQDLQLPTCLQWSTDETRLQQCRSRTLPCQSKVCRP